MKKILFFLIFISNTVIGQPDDCNLDRDCVVRVLTEKTIGWVLDTTVNLAWKGEDYFETSAIYFQFDVNGTLDILNVTVDCFDKIIKSDKLLNTKYKIITLNNYNQQGIRIYKFKPNISKFVHSGLKGPYKDSVDFQFLFNPNKSYIFLIENNSIQENTIKNVFK